MIPLLKTLFAQWFISHKEQLKTILLLFGLFILSNSMSIAFFIFLYFSNHPYLLYLYW